MSTIGPVSATSPTPPYANGNATTSSTTGSNPGSANGTTANGTTATGTTTTGGANDNSAGNNAINGGTKPPPGQAATTPGTSQKVDVFA